MEYVGEPMKMIVLFNCEWYDSTRPTITRKHNHYKIIEVNYTKIYDPFIIAQNAREVFYLLYLGKCKSNWRVVINTNTRDQVEVKEVSNEPYQLDDPIPLRLVVDIDILSNLFSASREVDIIDFLHQHSTIIIEDIEGEQEEEEFEDDVQSKSTEESLELSD